MRLFVHGCRYLKPVDLVNLSFSVCPIVGVSLAAIFTRLIEPVGIFFVGAKVGQRPDPGTLALTELEGRRRVRVGRRSHAC